MQPWRFEAEGDVIRAWIDPARSSLLDFRHRAALLALGAAREAADIGARALGFEPVALPVAAGGPAWELALRRSTRTRDAAAGGALARSGGRAPALLIGGSVGAPTTANGRPRVPRSRTGADTQTASPRAGTAATWPAK